ncbi:hypothetical protein RJ55_00374 [Drechmeria coniospora]|nr:hypothetical protein RJ55_00374 [Drechmeria coniospora]
MLYLQTGDSEPIPNLGAGRFQGPRPTAFPDVKLSGPSHATHDGTAFQTTAAGRKPPCAFFVVPSKACEKVNPIPTLNAPSSLGVRQEGGAVHQRRPTNPLHVLHGTEEIDDVTIASRRSQCHTHTASTFRRTFVSSPAQDASRHWPPGASQ